MPLIKQTEWGWCEEMSIQIIFFFLFFLSCIPPKWQSEGNNLSYNANFDFCDCFTVQLYYLTFNVSSSSSSFLFRSMSQRSSCSKQRTSSVVEQGRQIIVRAMFCRCYCLESSEWRMHKTRHRHCDTVFFFEECWYARLTDWGVIMLPFFGQVDKSCCDNIAWSLRKKKRNIEALSMEISFDWCVSKCLTNCGVSRLKRWLSAEFVFANTRHSFQG